MQRGREDLTQDRAVSPGGWHPVRLPARMPAMTQHYRPGNLGSAAATGLQ
jgi:hypothetical protein